MSLSVMFQGRVEKAMAFYAPACPDCAIDEIVHCGSGEAGPEGSVATARFHIGHQTILCIDSPVTRGFTIHACLFVGCESEAQIRETHAALSGGGEGLMPLGSYGTSRTFAWVNDPLRRLLTGESEVKAKLADGFSARHNGARVTLPFQFEMGPAVRGLGGGPPGLVDRAVNALAERGKALEGDHVDRLVEMQR